MKSAKWEASAGLLASFLGSRPAAAFRCYLYTFNLLGTLNSSAPLLFTTSDVDVTVPYATPITYSSKSVFFDSAGHRAVGHQKIGLDVDSWQVQLSPALPNGSYVGATIGNVAFLKAAAAGALSGALVTVDMAVWDIRSQGLPTGNPIKPNVGVFTRFYGAVAEIDIGRSQCALTVNDQRDLLSLQMPRNVYGPKCRFTLFGTGCNADGALAAANYATSGSVTASSGNTVSATLAAPAGSGTYALGRIVMTSGSNNGFARQIRSWTQGSPSVLTLIAPFPFALAVGDTFTVYPGCDHSFGSCSLFSNGQPLTAFERFGGAPFIPNPEVVA